MGSRTWAHVVPWWLAGADRPEEFEGRTEALYDEEQQRAILTAAGVAWRRQLKLVGILVRTAPADGRAAIRRREDEVDKLLPETRLHRSSSARASASCCPGILRWLTRLFPA